MSANCSIRIEHIRLVYEPFTNGIRTSRLSFGCSLSALHTVWRKVFAQRYLTLLLLPNRKELINLPSIMEETNVANNCDTFALVERFTKTHCLCQAVCDNHPATHGSSRHVLVEQECTGEYTANQRRRFRKHSSSLSRLHQLPAMLISNSGSFFLANSAFKSP